jgi:uncharacterized protein (DUF1684 family)
MQCERTATNPIEVEQTSDGHVRVLGVVTDDDRKQEILARLKLLDHHQLLQTQLVSPDDMHKHSTKAPQPVTRVVSRYELDEAKDPADAELRAYFQAQGLSRDLLNAAVVGFSREALRPAQHALRNASALSRLGSAFPPHPPAIKYPFGRERI